MNLDYRSELKIWSIYLFTILVAVYVHEVGHCIPAWIKGFRAIPTPAKEYILDDMPPKLQQYVALGGILGTVFFTGTALVFSLTRNFKYSPTLLAGALAVPGVYSFRFLLLGRGHDGDEFQEAQSALGLNYSGHSLDWFLLAMFVAGVTVWLLRSRPGFGILGRLIFGSVLTVLFLISLQVLNNAIFDPMFES